MPPRFQSIIATALLSCSCGYVGLNLREDEQDGASKPQLGLGGSGVTSSPEDSIGGAPTNVGDGGSDGAPVESGAGGSGREPGSSTGSEPTTEPLFAEDFEGDILGMATTGAGATLKLTDERSHSGSGSLVATQGESGVGPTLRYDLTPWLGEDLYVRGWVYIPEGTVTGRIKLVGFRRDWGSLFDVNVTDAGRVDIYAQDTGERSTSRQSAHPYGEWFCLQAHYRVDSTRGFVEAFINEESVARIEPQDTRGVTSIDVGLSWTELGQTSGIVYWDDVAIDTAPIACEL